MYIEKVGQSKFGNWALFEYNSDNLSIKGIANTKLPLEQEKHYDNLLLQIVVKNNKTYYNILEK